MLSPGLHELSSTGFLCKILISFKDSYVSFYFSLDGYNTDGSDISSTPDLDLPYDISALRDSPTPFLCITDDNDVTHSPDSPGTPILFLVKYTFVIVNHAVSFI